VGQGLLSRHRQVDFVSIWICSMLVIFFRLAGNLVDQRQLATPTEFSLDIFL
jgi:hypothetical protein